MKCIRTEHVCLSNWANLNSVNYANLFRVEEILYSQIVSFYWLAILSPQTRFCFPATGGPCIEVKEEFSSWSTLCGHHKNTVVMLFLKIVNWCLQFCLKISQIFTLSAVNFLIYIFKLYIWILYYRTVSCYLNPLLNSTWYMYM